MTEFNINHVSKSKFTDNGVSVNELLKLIQKDNDLSNALLKALDIDSLHDEFINIAGAQQLVTIQKTINNRFYKEDFKSSLDNIVVNSDDGKLTFLFTDLSTSKYLSQLNLSSIELKPLYSSKNDFFSWLYGMDKYANELIKEGLDDILSHNLDFLRKLEIGSKDRRYRILQDLDNKQFYIRAIISLERYINYDNNIAIVIALISLHKKAKESGIIYALNRVEYKNLL